MGGGIMQLVAYGAQDIYLTGNPQITFFKIVYRRHTNFSMETIKQNISGQSFIGIDNINNKATVTISRNGDLVTGVYVLAKQTDTNNSVGICGDNLVEDVEIEIGGQRIDKHYKEWNQIWDELTTPVSKSNGYKYMTGGFNNSFVSGGDTKQEMVRYPLKFWFCRNPGLALPLIALQYHEIQLKFTWGVGLYESTKDDNLTRSSTSLTAQHTVEVWADYVYLDTDERRRFSQVSHEYLIEQVQIQKEKDVSSESFKLNLEHPIKEIIWTTPQNPTDPITDQKIKLSINGHDRFYERDKEYFMLEQPYKYHTSIPGYNIKELDTPVLLNETIYSNPYTFKENVSTQLDALTGFSNVFTNHSITDKTSISGTSSLTSDTKVFLFKSNGAGTLDTMEFKVGDTVRVNYYKVSDDLRGGASSGDFTGNTKTVTRDYGGDGLPSGTADSVPLRLEMIPILAASAPADDQGLNNGTWRNRIVNTIVKAVVHTTVSSGSVITFTGETGGAIKVGDVVSGTGIVDADPTADPPVLATTVNSVSEDTANTKWTVTLSSAINSEIAADIILTFNQSTPHSGIRHDNSSSTNGNEWYYEDIVPAASRPRPVTLHTKVESTGDTTITTADHSEHEELNSSFLTQLDVDGQYKDKTVENVVRNLTVLKVFKTTFDGDTLFEVTFNDSINVTSSSNDKVSFEIIARVQNPISRCSQLKKDIYVYSFSLEPEEHQPSGSCNFSRIDSAKILLSSSCSISNIYAVNYNVLRILSGMGGLAYSS